MRISAKGRYGLGAMIMLAQNYNNNKYITVLSISEKLDISKIYLEQVFSLLKRGNLVISVKGAQGGYKLERKPDEIFVYDILKLIETPLFEETKETVQQIMPEIEKAMKDCIFEPLDKTVENKLKEIALEDLLNEVEKNKMEDNYMYFI